MVITGHSRSSISVSLKSKWDYIAKYNSCSQARREPQLGPGKHYCGALSPPPILYVIETPKTSKGRKRGESCPITIPTRVQESVVSSPSGVRGGAPAENGFYAYFMLEKKPSGTPFSVFLSDGGAPQTSRGPGKLSPLPPPLSTGLNSRRRHQFNTVNVFVSLYIKQSRRTVYSV